jgi:hypothetical protein
MIQSTKAIENMIAHSDPGNATSSIRFVEGLHLHVQRKRLKPRAGSGYLCPQLCDFGYSCIYHRVGWVNRGAYRRLRAHVALAATQQACGVYSGEGVRPIISRVRR